jgi:microcystin-dependent protein
MTLYKWSQTASADATADSTINWAEGQSPSSVNDSARAMMAATAKYRDDLAGAIVTGGTSTAYTVSSYEMFDTLAHLSGQMIAFTPHTTNGDTVTLNCDGLGAKPLRSSPSVELVAGTLVQGTPYAALYNSSDAAFYLHGFFSSPYNVPFLGGMDFWDTVTPNSTFIFPAGQAISRSVYARAFARWGTTFGAGDGSTTFNVPDKTGRTSVMKEASATRLTTAGSGVDGATLGAVGGVQNVFLAANQIPSLTSVNASQAISVAASQKVLNSPSGAIVDFNPAISNFARCLDNTAVATNVASTGNNSISTSYTNSSQVVTKTVQPTIVCNYILRII